MRCRYRSLQSDSSLRCCGFFKRQTSSRRIGQKLIAPTLLWEALHNAWRAMRSSFGLSASRTSIHFGGTDRKAGQCPKEPVVCRVAGNLRPSVSDERPAREIAVCHRRGSSRSVVVRAGHSERCRSLQQTRHVQRHPARLATVEGGELVLPTHQRHSKCESRCIERSLNCC